MLRVFLLAEEDFADEPQEMTGFESVDIDVTQEDEKKKNMREARKPSIRWELETHRRKKSTSMCSTSKTERLGCTKRCSLHSGSLPY